MARTFYASDAPSTSRPPVASRSLLVRRTSPRARSMIYGLIGAAVLVGLIALGSRGFHWFDAALIGYAVASVFSVAAITYKYTFWLSRPQTGRYFWRSWRLFFSLQNFRRYATLIPQAIVSGLLTQWFIRRRGISRWVTHQCIFWGVVLSCAITFPLTFGWLRFTQTPSQQYQMWVVGFAILAFPISSLFGFVVIHALDFTAVLLLIGLVLAYRRHFRDLAVIAVQRFRFDLVPLGLLLAIAVSGLALTADSAWLGGAYYWFISLAHEAVVVLWLISLPFGKFFHIIERPATIGIELYSRTGADTAAHPCPRCGQPFMPARFIADLKQTLGAIGEQYAIAAPAAQPVTLADGAAAPASTMPHPASATTAGGMWWQDFCPQCKRVLRAEANLVALGRHGNQFR